MKKLMVLMGTIVCILLLSHGTIRGQVYEHGYLVRVGDMAGDERTYLRGA